MKKPANPLQLTVKVAAELAAASAIMVGAGAFANAAYTAAASEDTTVSANSYYYAPPPKSSYYYY